MSEITTQAAEWLVKLSADDAPPSPRQLAEFEQWKQADARHASAVEKMQGLLGNLGSLPAQPVATTLHHAALSPSDDSTNWSQLAKMLCLVLVLLPTLWLISPEHQRIALFADQYTGTGEWQTITLSDQSQISLSSRSAINVRFTDQQRVVELLQGEILIDVSKDTQRPFVVQTPQGQLTALGTRFTVQRAAQSTRLSVFESRVRATSNAAPGSERTSSEKVLKPGQRISLFAGHLGAVETFDTASTESAWQSHLLIIENQPLPGVLEQLTPHYAGHLHYNAEALQHIRVYAVLPLDDPGKALQLLSESTAIELSQWTPWWINISLVK